MLASQHVGLLGPGNRASQQLLYRYISKPGRMTRHLEEEWRPNTQSGMSIGITNQHVGYTTLLERQQQGVGYLLGRWICTSQPLVNGLFESQQ